MYSTQDDNSVNLSEGRFNIMSVKINSAKSPARISNIFNMIFHNFICKIN